MAELTLEQIAGLKRIRRLLYSTWLALAAFVLWLALALPRPLVVLLVLAIPGGLYLYLSSRRCPRCGHHFFMERIDLAIPRFACAYCGLAFREAKRSGSN